MNSIFSLTKRDPDDDNPVAGSSNSESKTDEQNGSNGEKDQNSHSLIKIEVEYVMTLDDLERDGFEADNRILNSCNEVGIETRPPNRELPPYRPPGSRTLLFSGIPRHDLPGCSNSNDTTRIVVDSSRKPLYPVEAPPKEKPVISPDITERPIANMLYEGRDISDFSVPSTSNAEKFLDLVKIEVPSGSSSSSEDVDDEVEEKYCVDERLCRKRSGEPQSTQEQKKVYIVELPVPCKEENNPVSNPGSSSSSPESSNGLPEVNQWLEKFLSWPEKEKDKALEQLIGRCSVDQISHMNKLIEPLLRRDFIKLLPKEVALNILGNLQATDLSRAARTSRYWRILADDNLLWREHCSRIGIDALDEKIMRVSEHYTMSPWKAVYVRQCLIEDNWVRKPLSSFKVMKGHGNHVITCLQFHGNRILSGSDDTTLKIWSSVTGKCLRTLRGHTGGVWCGQMTASLVISGSTDKTLRIWNANNGRCLNILMGHFSTVRCMHLHKNRVVSGSRDTTLRVWCIRRGQCLKLLRGHLAAVRCVQFNGKVVVSGAYDSYVKIWNPETGECLHTLAGHQNRVYHLQFDGVHVVSGSLDTTICVWDVASGKLKRRLTGHQSLISGIELRHKILVSGNADSTIKVWNIETGECLYTLAGPNKHQSAITCLQTSNHFVITSSDDGTVKLWDIRTGQFIRNIIDLAPVGPYGVIFRIKATDTKLACAIGSRNSTEATKLFLLNFDLPKACGKCK